jgi:hypothetical protein
MEVEGTTLDIQLAGIEGIEHALAGMEGTIHCTCAGWLAGIEETGYALIDYKGTRHACTDRN